ncbi:CLUMA_CG001217, isoform A [Clunio marinus]|uniref:CLUMA_CG001217, isoform A n=1 Tax=Clunio marinus TaxID=568069 RepID=A0A1J1HHB2_9DIPT|nr:CLUMA_CG001217, isoform A [Clunio marinus]
MHLKVFLVILSILSIVSVDSTLFVKLNSSYISYSIDYLNSNGKVAPFIKKTTFDLCNYFKNQNGNKLLNWFYKKNISGERNLPTSCPIEPQTIFLKDFAIVEVELSTKINEKMATFVKIKLQLENKIREKWEKEIKTQNKIIYFGN